MPGRRTVVEMERTFVAAPAGTELTTRSVVHTLLGHRLVESAWALAGRALAPLVERAVSGRARGRRGEPQDGKLGARLAAGSDRLAQLVRKEQDLAAETETFCFQASPAGSSNYKTISEGTPCYHRIITGRALPAPGC
jgi:hypothetical protein